MKKTLIFIMLLVAGMLSFSNIMAAEEGQDAQSLSGDEIVAMCEEKYSADKYADEDERNNLIDKCINDMSGESKPAAEES